MAFAYALLLAALIAIGTGIWLVFNGTGPGPILTAAGVMLLVVAGAVRSKSKKKEMRDAGR